MGALVTIYVVSSGVMIVLGLLMIHVLVHGGLGHWDEHVNAWAASRRNSNLNRFSSDATFLANTLGIVAVGGVASLIVLLWRHSREALLLPCALATELAAFLTINYTVARPRPSVPHLGSTPSTYSWPSGHVAATLVLYGGIAVLVKTYARRRAPVILAWTLAGVLTISVGLSRVYSGQHHPTDAFAGLILGAAVLIGTSCALGLTRPSVPR